MAKRVGTIWVVAHDESCRFDAEDLRVMTNLGTLAAAAYQNLLLVDTSRRIASIVEFICRRDCEQEP